jgi:hypothetical protein
MASEPSETMFVGRWAIATLRQAVRVAQGGRPERRWIDRLTGWATLVAGRRAEVRHAGRRTIAA